jgi:hypothetical protein
MTLAEAARSFGLADNSSIYRSLEPMEANAIATRLLSVGLAYGLKIMSGCRANDLWQQFMAQFDGQDIKFFSNASAQTDSWTPATRATFDMGVLIIGATKAGCLWIEEED